MTADRRTPLAERRACVWLAKMSLDTVCLTLDRGLAVKSGGNISDIWKTTPVCSNSDSMHSSRPFTNSSKQQPFGLSARKTVRMVGDNGGRLTKMRLIWFHAELIKTVGRLARMD